MTFPHSHKTVIVLDRRAVFLESSKCPVEFDIFTKSRLQGLIPLAPISKSLWTCNVEAAVEYCRVVYDVYPLDSHICLIASDKEATSLNSWDKSQQNVQQLMNSLARIGGPTVPEKKSDDGNIINGLNAAIECLCELTGRQEQHMNAGTEPPLRNNGRIICLTQMNSESHLQLLEECVLDALDQHNKQAMRETERSLHPITHLEVVFIHTVPFSHSSVVTHKPRRDLSSNLTSEVHVTQSGTFISNKMVELCAVHFDLASTTVIGIPMKEELNASSSANYDVELLHPAAAHIELIKTGNVEGLTIASKEGLYFDTVTLKWCTPKSSSVELHQTTGAFRVTPVDVNSRPSSCLTNFLLNGRSVMLEQPRKSGTKVISHMLTSHGGELYIHVLATQRSCLEDPPSVSEGSGGRITDYRITDFCELIKDTRLAPVSTATDDKLPIDRALSQIERMTRYWPLVIGETIIFNMLSHVEPLHTLIVKETLDEEDVLECQKAIYHIVAMESRNDSLPVPNTGGGTRGKGPKRDEQYRQMWTELEKFIRAHESTSDNHQKVLKCLLECKGSTTEPDKKIKEEKVELSVADKALQDFDKFSKMSEKEKSGLVKTEVKQEAADSPAPPIKKAKTSSVDFYLPKSGNPQSLYTLWSTRVDALNTVRCPEFAYRNEHGPKAPLYQHMNEDAVKPESDDKANVQKPTIKPLLSGVLKSKR